MILNSNRFRTFEDARLKIVTYVEAKFGLRISDSKPSDTGSRGHSEPMDVDAVNSMSSDKGKDHRIHEMGVFLSAVDHIVNETAMHAQALATNRLARANRASHGPRVRAKERVKRTRENPKESPKGTKGAKGLQKGKTLKTGLSGLEKLEIRDKFRISGICTDVSHLQFLVSCGWSREWNDDWNLVGWHEGWE